MHNRWTYRVAKDERGIARYGDFIVSVDGQEAGGVTWVVVQDQGVMQWRRFDPLYGSCRLALMC